MYILVYRRHGLPEVHLKFKSESSLFGYVSTWLNENEDYIAYFHNGIKYDPPWTR